jgi:hypothetical protein
MVNGENRTEQIQEGYHLDDFKTTKSNNILLRVFSYDKDGNYTYEIIKNYNS